MTIEELQQFCLKTRLEKGIRQIDIEHNTGVSDTTLSRWENGKAGIRLDTLMLILKELGYELEVHKKCAEEAKMKKITITLDEYKTL